MPHFSQIHTHQFVTFRTQGCVDEFVRLMQESNLDESNKQFGIDQYLDHSDAGRVLDARIIDLTKLYCHQLDPDYYHLIALSVMPNHLHLLFAQRQGLDVIMQKLKGGLSRLINKRLQRSGHLWEKNYFDKAIRSERHLCATYRYIKNNAVAAGLPDAERRFWGLYG
jgi:putative transposase